MTSPAAQWRKRLLVMRGVLVALIALSAAAAALRQQSLPLPELFWPLIGLLWAPSLLYWPTRRYSPRAQQQLLCTELLYDTLMFLCLIYTLGGSANPISFYLLVPVLITALTQSARTNAALCVFQITSYGLLLNWHHVPATHSSLHAMTHEMPALHGQGMWLAFTLLAIAVSALGQTTQAAHRQQRAQQASELTLALQRERMYQLASTLADRAHELNTPLSTLMLQLDGVLDEEPQITPSLRQELQQMRLLTQRMAAVLKQQQLDEQDNAAGLPLSTLTEKLNAALKLLAPNLQISWQGHSDPILAPSFAWQRVLLNIGYNACDAGATRLLIACQQQRHHLIIQISDNGPRQPHSGRSGLGVGLALIETTLASLGGDVEIRSSAEWTQAVISIAQPSAPR